MGKSAVREILNQIEKLPDPDRALLESTLAPRASPHLRLYVVKLLLDEFQRVMTEKLAFARRFAVLSRQRILRRANATRLPSSRHAVPDDPNDSPILRTAIAAGADYLVTNDRHLLKLDHYEGLRIISMNDYERLLESAGLQRRRKEALRNEPLPQRPPVLTASRQLSRVPSFG